MSTIPFIEARFFSANEDRIELETRFMRHLRKLRCKRIPPDLLAPPDRIDAPGEIPDADPMGLSDSASMTRPASSVGSSGSWNVERRPRVSSI